MWVMRLGKAWAKVIKRMNQINVNETDRKKEILGRSHVRLTSRVGDWVGSKVGSIVGWEDKILMSLFQ